MSESASTLSVISDKTWRSYLTSATLAPSSHNTQPWLFHIDGDTVELYADRRRRLPTADPLDRELTMSCGACLYNLRVTLACAGLEAEVEILPDASNPDLLARVRAAASYTPTVRDRALFDAIDNRRTNRHAYLDTPVPAVVIDECKAAAEAEGTWVRVVRTGDDREALSKLVMHADHLQRSSAPFRKELAKWLRSNDPDVEDGMPGYAVGLGNLSARVAPLVVRTFDLGDGQAAKDLELMAHSPLIMVLGSANETPGDWMKAGQALEAVALTCTVHGVSMSYLNQAVEEGDTRPPLSELVDEKRPAQLILRLGFGPEAPATPRRPIGDVLI